jgi:hypothetical protein
MADTKDPIVELRFVPGQMRQPSLWGKVCQSNGGVIEYDQIPEQYDLELEKHTRKITLKGYPEGSFLIMGLRGYHAAGQLSNCYCLFQIKEGQHSEWQFTGHLAKFEGKNLLLITQSETDLAPIYKSMTEMKYGHLDRVQNFLRKERRDTAGPAPAGAAPLNQPPPPPAIPGPPPPPPGPPRK